CGPSYPVEQHKVEKQTSRYWSKTLCNAEQKDRLPMLVLKRLSENRARGCGHRARDSFPVLELRTCIQAQGRKHEPRGPACRSCSACIPGCGRCQDPSR